MIQNNQQQQRKKKTQFYYPLFIDEEKTQQKIEVQQRIIKKITNKISRRHQLPDQLNQKVCSFIFNSPIRLNCQIYKQVQNSKLTYGFFLLSNTSTNDILKIQLRRFWRKLQKSELSQDSIMRFAVHFDGVMEIRDNYIGFNSPESEGDKVKIVSENNLFYLNLLATINKYKKDRIINQFVTKAFRQLMSRYMAQVCVNDQQFLIIDRSQYSVQRQQQQQISNFPKIIYKNYKKKQQIQIGLKFFQNQLKIINKDLKIYKTSKKIERRGRISILSPEDLKQLVFNDIYIEI